MDEMLVSFGKRLMHEAEKIAAWHGYRSVAVIAGIGTRNYYRKLGYERDMGPGGFMFLDPPFWVFHFSNSGNGVLSINYIFLGLYQERS